MMKKAAVHNLGCKVNSYELDVMVQELCRAGYQMVPFEEKADLYLVNTCSVTSIADRKSRQMLHRAKHLNPEALVIAVGCYVETDRKRLEEDPLVDLCIGNNRKAGIAEIVKSYLEGRMEEKETCANLTDHPLFESMQLEAPGRTRADIKIQDGCNQFCTYCMIPYARGRIRSKKTEDVVGEVKRLAASGCQEVVLTGIHLSSYGKERPEEQENLLTLIQAVHEVEGIERIRLGSLEPGIITKEFAEAISSLPKVCPHFHLSLQSGCTATLKRMNRRYTAQEYREKCEILRKYYPAPALTTDVITGFPGETEEEFEESRSFVDSIHFYETHIFPYSKREGTKAAAMPDQLPEQVKKERSRILIALGQEHQREYMEQFLGKKKEVLFEEQQKIQGKTYWTGHTMEYLKVAVISEENLENKRVMVQLQKIIGQDLILAEQQNHMEQIGDPAEKQ